MAGRRQLDRARARKRLRDTRAHLVAHPRDVKDVGGIERERGPAREPLAAEQQERRRVGWLGRPPPLGDVAVLGRREREGDENARCVAEHRGRALLLQVGAHARNAERNVASDEVEDGSWCPPVRVGLRNVSAYHIRAETVTDRASQLRAPGQSATRRAGQRWRWGASEVAG